MVRVSFVLCITLLLAFGAASLAASQEPSSPPAPFTHWLPSDSYAGGKQYDPRLDQPVRFWGAGIPLRQVFFSIYEQSGIEIGFWPAGDINERVCVNLYLNRSAPPTLRELMAQLAWVTDCTFAYSQRELKPDYLLLSTSLGGGMERELANRARTEQEEMRTQMERWKAEGLAAVTAKLPEYRQALNLPRDELIRRYHGVDDKLLLNLLDSTRRQVTEFVCELPDSDIQQVLRGDAIHRQWRDWTIKQQMQLREGMSLTDEWLQRGVEFDVFSAGGLIGVLAMPLPTPGQNGLCMNVVPCDTIVSENASLGQHDLSYDETLQLRRLLDEITTSSEEKAFRSQWEATQAAKVDAQERWQLKDKIARSRNLTSEASEALSRVQVPVEWPNRYALWEVQQKVAASTTVSIVSDCFTQPRRYIDSDLRLLVTGDGARPTALDLLSASCISQEHDGGYEWSDAGSFLRFRSANRDIERASMLPLDALTTVDSWALPTLDEASLQEYGGVSVHIRINPRLLCQLILRLDDVQIRRGAGIIYEDPANRHNAALQQFRSRVMEPAATLPQLSRFLGSMSNDQWSRLQSDGLHWQYELTPDQQSSSMADLLQRDSEWDPSRGLLKIVERYSSEVEDDSIRPSAYVVMQALVDGHQLSSWEIPSIITLDPGEWRSTKPCVEEPRE